MRTTVPSMETKPPLCSRNHTTHNGAEAVPTSRDSRAWRRCSPPARRLPSLPLGIRSLTREGLRPERRRCESGTRWTMPKLVRVRYGSFVRCDESRALGGVDQHHLHIVSFRFFLTTTRGGKKCRTEKKVKKTNAKGGSSRGVLSRACAVLFTRASGRFLSSRRHERRRFLHVWGSM